MSTPGPSHFDDEVPSTIPIQTKTGLRLSALNPKYLHTNSTSHTWPFSAIAELVDNAYDPDVKASQLRIDLKHYGTTLAMTYTDNGNGMIPDKLYKMLSFGFCEKVAVKGHMPIGHYGNGFKSGSMRLGKDALVFTIGVKTRSVGYLSQTYLQAVKAETIIIPIVTWDNATLQIMDKNEKEKSLPALLKHSVMKSILEIKEEFSYISGMGTRTGTRIIITNMRMQGKATEFDFNTDKYDIRIPVDAVDSESSKYRREERQNHIPASDYSLRAYLSILYLKPKMQIFLRGDKVKTVVIKKSLSKTEVDLYKPMGYKPIKIVFGFSQNVNHYGIMMYHRNRLIKPYVRVGCQLKANNNGIGVIGVIECDSLQPTHNKQDFDYTPLFRSTMTALGQKLNDYWNEKCGYTVNTNEITDVGRPDELWAQCDNPNCLKWRKLPDFIQKEDLPKKWYCHMHPDPGWQSCEVPEEEEEPVDNVRPYEKKLKKIEKELRITGLRETAKHQNNNNFNIELERRRREKVEFEKQQQEVEMIRLRDEMAQLKGTFHIVKVDRRSNTPCHRELPSGASPSKTCRVDKHSQKSDMQSAPVESCVANTAIKQENIMDVNATPVPIHVVNATPVPLHVNMSSSSCEIRGSKKRPITLDSDEEDNADVSFNNKAVKLEQNTSINHNNKETQTSINTRTITSGNTPNTESMQNTENTSSSNTQNTESTVNDTSSMVASSIKDRVFRILSENLVGIDKDIVDELKKQSVTSLGLILAKRSQALRNLRLKVFTLIKSLVSEDIPLPDLTKMQDLENESVEELLDAVIDINVGDSDEGS